MAEHSQQTLELFTQIGSRLKHAREERGYTVQELASHTRINAAFLQKIEDGDLHGLPGMAFVKGFIRNYISVLQIEDPELDEALRQLVPPSGREAAQELQPSNPQVLDSEEPRVSYVRLGLYVALALLILWVGYVLFRGSGAPEPVARQNATTQPAAVDSVPAAAPGTSPSAATPPPSPTSPPGAAPSASPPATGAGSTTAPAAKAPPGRPAAPRQGRATTGPSAAPTRATGPLEGRQKLELTIRGLERTWVRLSLDRAPAIDVLMEPADTVAWQANQEIRLTVGNSSGVAIYLNGEEILLPAERNRLIPNLVLNKLTLLRLEN